MAVQGTRVDHHEDQVAAEKVQREAALGKRARAILKGDLGPVLKRWVSASIVPVATRLRGFSAARRGGDHDRASEILHSALFGMPSHAPEGKSLGAVLTWFDKAGVGEDLVLAVMGTTVTALARSGQDKPIPLTRILFAGGQAARETAMGQFVTQVQGAKAMQKVRRSDRASWAQHKKLDGIAALLGGQVRSALDEGDTEDEEIRLGGKAVVSILTPTGETRRIDLRKPSEDDWALLEVARNPEGAGDPHAGTWASFAMLVLVAAQAEAGWFDIAAIGATTNAKRKGHRKSTGLILSPASYEAIKQDLDKWLRMGFSAKPMVVPPVDGDYLTVKHRAVAGGRGPMGIKTQAKDSAAWYAASEVMAKTPWNVHAPLLRSIQESEFVRELVAKDFPDEVRRETVLNAYREFAPGQELYFPLYMDFRGRVYTRSGDATYQGKDLQKALLVFPNDFSKEPLRDAIAPIMSHVAALYGGPDKLDKASEMDRVTWYREGPVREAVLASLRGDWEAPALQDLLQGADEPLQLLTALTLHASGQLDRMPIDADGTCNGLQHLSALFRDEEAAPYVNLVGGTDKPADIYAEVAGRVSRKLGDAAMGGEVWAQRLVASVKIDRKLCKTPVMVLPYGGTRGTIDEAVLEAILAQEPWPGTWTQGRNQKEWEGVWPDWLAGNYAAFSQRDLKDHPLLHSDAKKLGGLVWDCITEVIPKAMAAMQTFRDIAKTVGDRTLEWDTQYGTATHDSLWVIQAKAKSERSTLKFKGLHLPSSVRGLSIRSGRDDVDAASHTSGIVANRIHSLDATHLARTMGLFGEPSFGAIHDSFRTRPSQRAFLDTCTRRAFRAMYLLDPLAGGVMMYEPGEKRGRAYGSWYELAKDCGTEFPEDGTWEPGEVMNSKWFFS